MFHFINFKYSLANSKEVVLYFCKRYELDQARTHLLLSELEAAQNECQLALTPAELQSISKEKISKRIEKCQGDRNMLVLQQSLKFIGPCPNDKVLLNFMMLNKASSKMLSKQVLKQALVYEIDT